MKNSSVCGVGESFEAASDAALERLLDQFGRNGPLSEDQATKKAEIEAVLASRKGAGVSVEENGAMHYPA
ncbi:MAG: hypothetical protein RLZZ480_420 [Candidatus Parcubacteria bacterium]|jgi:hypothetical protein